MCAPLYRARSGLPRRNDAAQQSDAVPPGLFRPRASVEGLTVDTGATDSMAPADELGRLGVTALESVGIVVDPTNKTPNRLPAIPLR